MTEIKLRGRLVAGFFICAVAIAGLFCLVPLYSLENNKERWVDQTLKSSSLEEKIGQLLQVRYYSDYGTLDSPEYRHLRDEIQKYHIGSVVLGMHFNRSGPIRCSPLETARIANELQRDSKLPLLMAADIERGIASRVSDVPAFPWPMAFGAVANASEVERFGAITAREARAVGIHWALAPVADVNSNPANPVINDRSFGEDPDQVSALVAAFIRGAHKNALLVTAKHFPGNGDTVVDSHHAVASIGANIEHFEKIEFPPFRAAIAAGVDSIMLVHAKVPALEADPDTITTVSGKVINGVLRGQLGFKGVVVTDALEMRGITKMYDPSKGSPTARAAVDAVKAGCDVIMIPTDLDGAFHAIIDAVKNGEISEAQINGSVRKMLRMKAALGLDENRFVDLEQVTALASKPEDVAFGQQVADEAITLIRDNAKLLPLRRQNLSVTKTPSTQNSVPQKQLVVIILSEALEALNGRDVEREVRARRPDATIFRFDGRFSASMVPQILQAVADADQIVLATYVVHGAARQTVTDGKQISYFGLRGLSGRLFEEIITKYSQKAGVIALGSPYLIEGFPQIQTYICTYAMASTSEISAVRALFGEIQNHAKLPVTLPGIAARGFSILWPTELRRPASD
jgi:beta-N-acetylhexosaminidase